MNRGNERTSGQSLRDALCYQPKNGYDRITAEEHDQIEAYCRDYKQFLTVCKTERDCVDYVVELAEKSGFRAYQRGMELKPGDRIYRKNRGKAIMLAVIGANAPDKGVHIGAAHIDSPRLDLKPNPMYESEEMAFLKTHYYGGIRKYQWVTIPLELRGTVVRKDGSTVKISLGDKPGDPQFTICDLLPHLGGEQAKKPLGEAVPGEKLNLLVGSIPLRDDEGSDRVKLSILSLLHETYGIVEEDFLSAELCAVPAFEARDIGFDRSLIGAYGHDDRVCAYAVLQALLSLQIPSHTAVCILADKEEIGSEGVTGMKSAAFDTFMEDLCESFHVPVRACYQASKCLSADVTAAYDPAFSEVFEKKNSAMVNYGVALCKYTGVRGKSGSSDASAELVAWFREIFDRAGVVWQLAELGKVDAGGGGTVAKFMAERDIDTLDAGVAVLSMHAPFETVSKLDCYMTYRAGKAFYLA